MNNRGIKNVRLELELREKELVMKDKEMQKLNELVYQIVVLITLRQMMSW